jgi:hypothetical protein
MSIKRLKYRKPPHSRRLICARKGPAKRDPGRSPRPIRAMRNRVVKNGGDWPLGRGAVDAIGSASKIAAAEQAADYSRTRLSQP